MKKTPRQSLSKAYLKSPVARPEMEQFKTAFVTMQAKIDAEQNEEHLKNDVRDFLLDAYYKGDYEINVKDTKDLVIHNGPKTTDSVGVIIEAKSIRNTAEMVTQTNLNKKALQELILYYLREREDEGNLNIKHLIITNAHEWFVFDANAFEKLVYSDHKLLKSYKTYRLEGKSTSYFYEHITKPHIAKIEEELDYTYFDISKYNKIITNDDQADDKQLVALFKLLSPTHILKKPFANDSNSLNRHFYNELLHIIGLEEVSQKGKKVIQRKAEARREPASLLENVINILKYETNVPTAKYFDTALELCITWVNRILFLKLLESQLITYNQGDESYRFLDFKRLGNYDALNKLFFQVLAIRPEDRRPTVQDAYSKVPYLNSSLFEVSTIESRTLKISGLEDDGILSILYATVLKGEKGKKAKGSINTLEYLFRFLEAYNFSSEGGEQIQEESKTLINASVLGLIFEKINGYKDGSFFTPGFITMYMCRETIRRSILQKYREQTDFDSEDWDELRNYIGRPYKKEELQRHNAIIDEIKICDPAVGSGHFLVSALNEMISCKSELGILWDGHKNRLSVIATVDNDELILENDNADHDLFHYDHQSSESQRVQQAIFHEKRRIIENCLFGVDINPNSVKICRLRLWIELLKNAYYTAESKYTDLETLPNIDINIKCGNSLISRFDLDSNLKPALKKSKYTIDSYKLAVQNYKSATDKEQKRAFSELIDSIKGDFQSEVRSKDKLDLAKLESQFFDRFSTATLIEVELTKTEQKKKDKEKKKLLEKIEKKKLAIEEIQNNKIYENAFEWRFEFPEVLDDEGEYKGFDVVIGNPPYFSMSKIKEQSKYFSNSKYQTYSKGSDIYCLFFELGGYILNSKGILTYITSNSWLRAIYGDLLKTYFRETLNPQLILNIEDLQIFEEATVESNITIASKTVNDNITIVNLEQDFTLGESLGKYSKDVQFKIDMPEGNEWFIGAKEVGDLKLKIESESILLKTLDVQINFGIKTGYNSAFIIDQEKYDELMSLDANNTKILKPIIRGRDLSKYDIAFSSMYAICTFPSLMINIDNFPSIHQYLMNIGKTRLEQSGNKGSRKKTSNKWYETQDSISYHKEFSKPKIVWGEISDRPKFAFDDTGYNVEATSFLMTGEKLKFLLAILNSKLSEWYFALIGTTTGMGTNRWKKYKIEQFPIKITTDKIELTIESKVTQIIDLKKQDQPTDHLEAEIDVMVYKLYELMYDEVLIVDPEFGMTEAEYEGFEMDGSN